MSGPETARETVEFGLLLREARTVNGLSLSQLAASTGVSRRHIIKLEAGRHFPHRYTVVKIGIATGRAWHLVRAWEQVVALGEPSLPGPGSGDGSPSAPVEATLNSGPALSTDGAS